MAQRKLRTVLADFSRSFQECRRLAADAYLWSLPGAHGARPYISERRRDSLIELAFLRAFLAWETFLEQSFILYLTGQQPPRGRAPRRYAFPPNPRVAVVWLKPESGRDYVDWTIATIVSVRAERFFQAGRPFASVLRGNQNVLDDARLIRNAIAHESASARAKFETVVRTKLGTLPPKFTAGGFLSMTMPGSAPPASFLEFYLGRIEFAARQIVPS